MHPVFTVERDDAGRLIGFRGDGAGDRRRAARKLHPYPCRAHRRTRRASAEIVAGARAGARRCARRACRTGGRCWRASARSSPSSRPIRRRCRSTRSPRPSQFLEWLVANNFTFLGLRDYALDAATATDSSRITRRGLGILRDPDVRVLRRGDRAGRRSRRRSCEFLQGAAARSSSPRRTCARACTGASTWTMSASSASTTAASSSANSASSACSPRPPIRARPARSRICAARSTHVIARAGFDPDGHSGKALSTCWRPIRATSCSRSTTTRSTTSRSRSCSSTSGRACACWRGATASTASSRSSSIVPRERYDSAVRSAIGDYLADAYKGRVCAFYPFFPEGPLVRVHFIIGRSEGDDAAIRTAPTLEQAGRGDRAHLDRRLARGAGAASRPGQGAARSCDALPRRLLRRLSRSLSRRRSRSATSA